MIESAHDEVNLLIGDGCQTADVLERTVAPAIGTLIQALPPMRRM